MKVNVGGATAFSGPVVPATDKVLLEDGGVNKSATYQELVNGLDDLTTQAFATGTKIAVVKGGTAGSDSVDSLATFMAGAGLTATNGVLATTSQLWVMRIPGVSGVATDGLSGCLAGCEETLDITATEAAVTFAKVYNDDDTSYEDLSTSDDNAAFTANYQLFPDTEEEGDAAYFGGAAPFAQLYFDVATTATYNAAAASQIWEYFKTGTPGTWDTLPIKADSSDAGGAAVGQQPFGSDGCVTFVPPADWITTTVDDQEAYWIRCRCTAAVDITTIPTLNSVEHKLCAPTDGFKAPFTGNISSLRIVDGVATAHAANDIKFFLMNFTKGTYSLELTFPKNKRQDVFTGTALKADSAGVDVDAGDVLGLVVTGEDNTNELTNVAVELTVTPA